MRATSALLGDILGYLYGQIAFTGNSGDIAASMLNDIEKSFANDLMLLRWMDNNTRAYALTKLSMVSNMIGS